MENVLSFIRKFSVLIEQFINVIIRVLFILFALQNSVDFLLLDVFLKHEALEQSFKTENLPFKNSIE